jgi:hypothetical protein
MENILIPNQIESLVSFNVTQAQPLDAKTLFVTLEAACGQNTMTDFGGLNPTLRFKGQKFTIQNPPDGNGPKDYWFTESFVSRPPPQGGPIIPVPVPYEPGGGTGSDIDKSDLTGDKLYAQHGTVTPENTFENVGGGKMTINQYADRQPGAKIYTTTEFDSIAASVSVGNRKLDGTYYVK